MMLPNVLSLVLLCGAYAVHSPSVARSRFTRMSVVDYYHNETHGDGINVKVAHNVNTFEGLFPYLNDHNANNSYLLEGDVALEKHDTWLPMMSKSAAMGKRDIGMPLSRWLEMVAGSKKALKLNLLSTSVIKPALGHLFTTKHNINSPIILHADVWRSPNSDQPPVNARRFVREVQRLFPDVTISVGDTHPTSHEHFSSSATKANRLTWRRLFDKLQYVYNLNQPVMFVIDAPVAQFSVHEIVWLLGVKDTFSVMIKSDPSDNVTEWIQLVQLRSLAPRSQTVWDLATVHKSKLKHHERKYSHMFAPLRTAFNRDKWNVVRFLAPTQQLSTVVLGSTGPAFIGHPVALLVSERPPEYGSYAHYVTGRVNFVPKKNVYSIAGERHGIAIYLLKDISNLPSHNIYSGIEVLIASDGWVSITNNDYLDDHRTHPFARVETSIVGGLVSHDCYAFVLADYGYEIELTVRVDKCKGDDVTEPKHGYFSTKLTLRVPLQATQRHIVIKKHGDELVDAWIDNLQHSDTSSGVRWQSSTLILTIIIISFLQISR